MGPGGGAPLVLKGSLMRCSGEITKKRDTSKIAEASRWRRPPEAVAGGEPLRSQVLGE